MSILQGCPTSMLLLAGLMAIWTRVVADEDHEEREFDDNGKMSITGNSDGSSDRKDVNEGKAGARADPLEAEVPLNNKNQVGCTRIYPGKDIMDEHAETNDGIPMHFSIFVDDRALWATGRRASAKVARVLARAVLINKWIGLEMRPDKCDAFATKLKSRKQTKELLAEYIGNKACVHTFKLMGIWYNTTRMHRCHGERTTFRRSRKGDKLCWATTNVSFDCQSSFL